MLVPVVVREHGDGYELVAGFHRIAAAKSLRLTEVPVVIPQGADCASSHSATWGWSSLRTKPRNASPGRPRSPR